jgi:hypothetical protein
MICGGMGAGGRRAVGIGMTTRFVLAVWLDYSVPHIKLNITRSVPTTTARFAAVTLRFVLTHTVLQSSARLY